MAGSRRNDFEADHPYVEAMRLLAKERPNEALALLEAIVDPAHPAAYDATLAEAYRALGRLPEAVDRAQRAIDGGWDTPRLRDLLGRALIGMGLRDEARIHLEKATHEPNAELALGWIAYREGRFEEAEACASQALDPWPDDVAARCLLLAARAAQGDVVARDGLRRAWSEEGRSEAIEYLVLDAKRRKDFGWLDAILPEFRQAAADDPRIARLTLRLFYDRRGPDEALRLFYELPEAIRDVPIVLTIASWMLWQVGRRSESLTLAERAFEIDPTNEEAARRLGRAALRLGRWRTMVRCAVRYIRTTQRYLDAAQAESKRTDRDRST